MAVPNKKKCLQYLVQYLSYGFLLSSNNQTRPMCLICMDVVSNDSIKPYKLKIYLETKHQENQTLECF